MDRTTFQEVIEKVPLLAAEGLMKQGDPEIAAKRQEFLTDSVYLRETADAVTFLSHIGKSDRFSQWQRENCSPESLKALIEWHIGHPIAFGSIIAAALQLGFTMGVQDNNKVYFNLLARQIETELAQLRTQQQICKVVGT